MYLGLNSLSSSLMLGTTLYRNQPGVTNKIAAQVGYALNAIVAAVETVVSLAFAALSLVVYPFSSKPFEHTSKWLSSSAFTLGWSLTNFVLNLFVDKLAADERSARHMFQRGNLRVIPHECIV